MSVPKISRRRSPMYMVGVALLLPYIAVVLLMILNPFIELDSEAPYHCTIGYGLMGSVPALCYDVFLTTLSASFFLKSYFFPSIAQKNSNLLGALKIKAKRNLVVSMVACLTAIFSRLLLILLGGRERGLVMLSVCTLVRFERRERERERKKTRVNNIHLLN